MRRHRRMRRREQEALVKLISIIIMIFVLCILVSFVMPYFRLLMIALYKVFLFAIGFLGVCFVIYVLARK